MSELPAGWAYATLDELTVPSRPICYGILMPKDHVEDGVPYVKVKDFSRGPLDVAALRRTAPEIAEKYRRSSLVGGDVLISIRGTYGRVVIAPESLTGGNITQDTARVAPVAELDRDYLAWFLQCPDAQGYFRRVARGVAVKGVNIRDLKHLVVPLPPRAEQERIVAAIEEHLSRLAAAVSALRSVRCRYERGLAPLLAAFLGGSGEARRVKLGLVGRWSSGGTPRSSQSDYYDGDIPWAVIGDLDDGPVTTTARTITRLGLEESSAKLIPPGAVLVAMYGSIGKLGITTREMATNQAIAAVQPFEDVIDREYLFWLLRSLRPILISMGKGAAQQNIGQGDLKSFEVSLPGLQEQQKAVARVEGTLGALRTVDMEVERAIARAESLRRSILAAAFSGRLVPQNPDDERVSMLLDRILSERAAAATPTKRNRKAKAS
jgi:restriction endonuclease S subunit